MIINHNLPGSNAIRQMNTNSATASKSMQKLSSGLRINNASDDAAGLAISEKMRGQIRGLDQASSNAQDGISLTQTAEGALSETTSILQRMRELGVQSATDTNTADDRAKIQSETDELAKEITRISNTTEFNSQNLLNGGVQSGNTGELTFHIGANSGQNLSLSIKAMDAKTLGVSRDALTGTIGAANNAGLSSVEADNGIDAGNKLTAGTYKVTVVDTVAGASTATKATGNTVTVGTDTVTGTATADTTVTLTYSATVVGTSASVAGAQAGATTGDTLAFGAGANGAEFNGVKIELTGAGQDGAPVATWDSVNNKVVVSLDNTTKSNNTAAKIQEAIKRLNTVTKSDGTTTVNLSSVTATGAGDFSTGGAEINDAKTFVSASFAGGATAATAAWTATGDLTGTVSGATNAVNGLNIDTTKLTGAAGGDVVTITGTKDASTTVQLFNSAGTTSIGNTIKIDQANGGTYKVGDTTTGKMSVTFEAGTATTGTSTVTVAQTASTATTFADGQKSVDASVSGGIDVSSQDSANLAITKIDTAIKTVSSERAKLGAYSNRLEHTIANLGTSSENLTSAESRIRDVDMAKEMATFSKNNILSQAAQAMLAQANTQPQQVLQLLR